MPCQVLIVGQNDLRLIRASSVMNCQLAVAWSLLQAASQLVTWVLLATKMLIHPNSVQEHKSWSDTRGDLTIWTGLVATGCLSTDLQS